MTGCCHIQGTEGCAGVAGQGGGRCRWQLCQSTAALGASQPAVQHGLQHAGSRVGHKCWLLRENKNPARNCKEVKGRGMRL